LTSANVYDDVIMKTSLREFIS